MCVRVRTHAQVCIAPAHIKLKERIFFSAEDDTRVISGLMRYIKDVSGFQFQQLTTHY